MQKIDFNVKNSIGRYSDSNNLLNSKNVSFYDFKCLECGNKTYFDVLTDYAGILIDNKLCCPFCFSLNIREVNE